MHGERGGRSCCRFITDQGLRGSPWPFLVEYGAEIWLATGSLCRAVRHCLEAFHCIIFWNPSEQIRNAWDDTKSVARNLAEMGLSVDPTQKMSIRRGKVMSMDVDPTAEQNTSVRKPYVLKGLQAVASLPEKSSKGISLDMIEYVRHMIESHGQNYKAMARDEKNYYQDTPKQIKKKIDLYQRHRPEEYRALLDSLKQVKMDQ